MKKKLNCIMLIGDDEPTNFINTIYIEEAQCKDHIQVTDSGPKALNYLIGSEEFACDNGNFRCSDLIFPDINTPAMDGWQFLDKYKQLPKERHDKAIIIMLTTSLNPDDKIRASRPEISGVATKPLTVELLDQVLPEHFNWQLLKSTQNPHISLT